MITLYNNEWIGYKKIKKQVYIEIQLNLLMELLNIKINKYMIKI